MPTICPALCHTHGAKWKKKGNEHSAWVHRETTDCCNLVWCLCQFVALWPLAVNLAHLFRSFFLLKIGIIIVLLYVITRESLLNDARGSLILLAITFVGKHRSPFSINVPSENQWILKSSDLELLREDFKKLFST